MSDLLRSDPRFVGLTNRVGLPTVPLSSGPIIQQLDPQIRYPPRRLRSHRADRRRRNGASVSGDGHEAETPGRDQDPARVVATSSTTTHVRSATPSN